MQASARNLILKQLDLSTGALLGFHFFNIHITCFDGNSMVAKNAVGDLLDFTRIQNDPSFLTGDFTLQDLTIQY